MTGLTWLHLSDWHQKGNEFDRQVVLKALLKDIREREKINPCLQKIDFVIFSGDIAFSGKTEEYQTATEQFFKPLLDACGLTAKQLFVLPGNHDLDRDEFKLLPRDLTKPLATEAAVQSWLTDDRSRTRLLEPFRAFSSFVKDYTGQEQADYVHVRRMPIGDKEVALIGLNSAWMCGRNKAKIGDKGFVIVGEPQISSVLDEVSDADLKIAVLHHPFDWLTEFDCNRIETRLLQGCDFILRGHQHKPKVEVTSGTSGNCVIIPAGASYDRRMAENPAYANSYNFVHLDLDTGRGTVFLRRWSDPRNEWVEDIDSCDKGECNFTLSGAAPIASSSEKAPQTTKIIPHQIPPPPRDFKGREDEISDILSSFEKGATITGLRGMGGIGKTALALVLAEKIKSRFPDGQIFVDMRGTSNNPDLPPLTPEDAMAQIIRAYNPADRLPENYGELRGLYHSILSGKRVFLLLDNAAGREQVEPLLPPTGCAVLITSRIKFALPGLAEKDLDILPLDKSCELLLQIAPRIGNRAEGLAKICGCLPLALRNAASAVAEKKDLRVDDYESRLKDKVALLELVKGSFSLSYDLLTSLRKKHWRRLSVFPEDFEHKAAIAVLKMAPDASAEALSDLVRWSLVDYIEVPDSEEGRYKLHDLARIFAESRLGLAERADVQLRHSKHYMRMILESEKLYNMGGKKILAGLELFDREWANIKVGEAYLEGLIQNAGNLKNEASLKVAMQLADSYSDEGTYVLNLRLHPMDRIHWFENSLNAARKRMNCESEGQYLMNLGLAYTDLGKNHQAIDYYEQALDIADKIRSHSSECSILCNMGIAYSDLSENRKAIECYERALTIERNIGDYRGEGSTLVNMGVVFSDLGETRKAIQYYEQGLAIVRKIGDRKNESAAFGNLGAAYKDIGETNKAIDYYKQALVIAREIGYKTNEGGQLGNLGNSYYDLGETRKAIEYYEQALVISRENGDRMGEGAWLGNLGSVYVKLSETRKAIEHYEQALAIAKEIGDRRNEGVWLGYLGLAYADLSEIHKAIEHYEQALAIAKEIGDRRNEGLWLSCLGLAYADLSETRKAIEYYDHALTIDREIEDKRGEGIDLGNLGQSHAGIGETHKAIDCYDQALAIAKETGDKQKESEHLCNLGKAYLDLNEPDKTIDYCTQSLDLASKIEYRKFEGEALNVLGRAYTSLNQLDKALDHLDQALKIFKDIEYRRGQGEALFARSLALDKLDRRAEAEAQASEALEIFEQIKNPIQAQKVRQQLASWQSPKEEN